MSEETKVSNMIIDSLKTQEEIYYKAKMKELYEVKIKDLQQKVEQLEKENKELKYDCSCGFHDAEELNQKLTEIIDERNELDTKLIQLENIRKEAIEYVKNGSYFDGSSICANDLLNILNKGDNKE